MPEVTAVISPPQSSEESFQREVASRFGLIPNFFQTAKDAPGLIQELWSFAKSGYLDNPLPSVFKERLFVHLSRFCEVRYCIVRHVGFLVGQGNPAGDPAAIPHTIEQAVTLLKQPAMLADEELDEVYARLRLTRFEQLPAMETREEKDIFAAASVMFVRPGGSQQAAKALRAAVGGANFEILTAFLAFIRTAHYWTLTHLELTFEADMAAMLVAHDHLAKLLLDVSDAAHSQLPTQLHRELLSLRQEHDDRQALREALAGQELARRHQQMLINELNHRVKNTLAIVQSLAHQTLRGADVPVSVREAFTGRLVALAEAHDLLNGERWVGALLSGVLLQAIQAQAPDMVDRIRLDGPALRLDPKQALSIAMAAHELLTNAIKYGALSTSSGVINITWRTYDDSPVWVELSWIETGGPRVVAPSRSGFGSRLIQRGLPAELEGEASLFFASEGVRCVINAPLTMVG